MIKNLKKKKKGFTLVEVIIVLAIIAIIAAIAIPNLTKVRQDSKIKADKQSLETIERTINMMLTEESLPSAKKLTITIQDGNTIEVDGLTNPNEVIENLKGYLSEIRSPQAEGKVAYVINVSADGEITGATATTTN